MSHHKPKKTCELLAPAGNLEKLKTAIHYGADAVYLAGKHLGLRANAANFTHDEMAEAVRFAHDRGVRVYVTINILAHNQDLDGLEEYLLFLADIGVDSLIIADPGILRLARQTVPAMDLHLSTQANVTNVESCRFWLDQGVSRLNLARELSLAEISAIKKEIKGEVEVFVHGALCISYSGRCMLSIYLTGRDANRGSCAHPCRYSYRLEEAKRPGQFFPVTETERGTHIFNSKDLCLINRLPELTEAGVGSIKIEGRMKGIYYAGGIVRIYRAALDYLEKARQNEPGQAVTIPPRFMEEIEKLGSRGYTENFIDGPPQTGDMLYTGPKVTQTYIPAATVTGTGAQPTVLTRHTLHLGDELEYLAPGLENIPFTITGLADEKGVPFTQAHQGNTVRLTTSPAIAMEEHALIRKVQQ